MLAAQNQGTRSFSENVPEEEKGRYHTVSGMIILLLGRMPFTGDHVNWLDWRFEVVDMDGKRIDKILAVPVPLA